MLTLPEHITKLIESVIPFYNRVRFKKIAQIAYDIAEVLKTGRCYQWSWNEDELLAYTFYFMPKTYISCLLAASNISLEKETLRILDVACGTGSASLAVLDIFSPEKAEIVLQDSNPTPIKLAEEFIRKLHRNVSTKRVVCNGEDIHRYIKGNFDIILVSFSLFDIFGGNTEDIKNWIRRVLFKYGGIQVIIEPALKSRARALMEIRDTFKESVVAPCTHNLPCPMLKSDWCHFGIKWNAPDVIRNGIYLVGGKPPDINFSFIAFGDTSKTPKLIRLVSHRLPEKGRIRVFGCWNGKKVEIHVFKRDISETNSDIRRCEVGDLVRISGYEDRGRFLRILKNGMFKIDRDFDDIIYYKEEL